MFQMYGHESILEVNKFSACTSLVKLAFSVQQRLFTSFVRLKFQLKGQKFQFQVFFYKCSQFSDFGSINFADFHCTCKRFAIE